MLSLAMLLVLDMFGSAVVSVGDADRDGHQDFAISDPLGGPSESPGSGIIWVVSGRTGKLLYTLLGSRPGEGFGSAIIGGKDLDSDGVLDFAVTTAAIPSSGILVYSGRNGEVLDKITIQTPTRPGVVVSFAPDLDGDKCPDIVYAHSASASIQQLTCYSPARHKVLKVATLTGRSLISNMLCLDAPRATAPEELFIVMSRGNSYTQGSLTLPSQTDWVDNSLQCMRFGADNPQWTIAAPSPESCFGFSMVVLKDWNEDGWMDLAAGSPALKQSGSVLCLSGKDGRALGEFTSKDSKASFGRSICELDDLDSDGRNELAIGAPRAGALGEVAIMSGKSRLPIRELQSDSLDDSQFGSLVLSVDDCDDDGVPDLLVAATTPSGNMFYAGKVRVFSTATGKTLREWTRSSITSGSKK